MPIQELSVQDSIVFVENVYKFYGDRPVLNGISLSVRRGERLALMGPSGSGKTTLMNCLGGVDRADRGSISICGDRVQSLQSSELARLRREKIGTVFQFFHLLPTLTAFENVELPLQLMGVPANQRKPRVDELLNRVGISSRQEALPGQLSGGEMQRVAIARALVHRPLLILADEPTGNLDTANGQNILDLLESLSEQTATTLILVTHSLEATRICHRVVQMRDGTICGEVRH